MKKRVVRLVISCFAVAVVALLLPQGVLACTSFHVKANDGTVVIGRSNEFGIDAHSQIVFESAGKEFISKTPDGKAGMPQGSALLLSLSTEKRRSTIIP